MTGLNGNTGFHFTKTLRKSMTSAALLIGVIIATEGVLGLFDPQGFAVTASRVHAPTVIYFVAGVRLLFGAIVLGSAAASRAPRLMLGAGAILALIGTMTPVLGDWFAATLADWLIAGHSGYVRLWMSGLLLLGAAIAYAYVGVSYRTGHGEPANWARGNDS
jgi:phosphoglycerol transferase MdoB-like AlkP superfamily enzyme